MDKKYKVRFYQDDNYEVIETITKYGNRISAYDSEPDTVEKNSVYQGRLSDCESYIRLNESGYM